MSAYLYDEAVVKDLRRIVGDSRIKIMPVNNAFDVIPRTDNDNFTLPLITLTRTGWTIQSLNNNHSARYEGAVAEISYEPNKYCDLNLKRVQFVPMTISYSLDVWTRYRQENDEIVRELYWYYLTSPTLEITVPYDLGFDHHFNLFVEQEVEDNSDISQHMVKGEYFRQTLNLFTDDAKLWKSSSRGPTSVLINFRPQQQSVAQAAVDRQPTTTENTEEDSQWGGQYIDT